MTLRESTAPSEPATHSVEAKAFTILFRLCSTARYRHQEFAPDPVHHLFNVSTGINIAVRSILKDGQKPTPCTLLPLEIVAKLNDIILESELRTLTRAQQICIIMGALDMRGLVGAATIMGCLKYGACFSGLDAQDDPVLLLRLKDEDLLEAPDDSSFLHSLRLSCLRVMECIRRWPWLKSLLLMMIVPQGCDDSTSLWWT